MEIIRYKDGRRKGQMIRLSKDEALSLIRSLTNQMIAGNPNTGRLESYALVTDTHTEKETSEYFSISVHKTSRQGW